MAKKTNEKRSRALRFQVTEAYKKARTNLVYSIIKKGCKKIIVTSPYKSEGKTTTVVNLAIALSQQVNVKVLVIDCDLRRPTTHNLFDITNENGLANYLMGECSLDDVIVGTGRDNLDMVTYGAIPPNPSELLSSEGMAEMVAELEHKYDFIIDSRNHRQPDSDARNLKGRLLPLQSETLGLLQVTGLLITKQSG